MKTNVQILFLLLRNAVFGTTVDEEIKIAIIEHLDDIYKLAKYHDVAHLVSFSIEKNKISLPQTEVAKKLKKRHPIALLRYETANQVFCHVCDLFESERIPFIPLKGSVIREYYPEPWMRTSCDIDILVREDDLDRASDILVNACGCKKEKKGTHDISFFSPNGIHIELHYKLSEIYFDSSAEVFLDKVWDFTYPKSGFAYHHVLKDEFFYMFHIYHMAKHFEIGGCGIRPFLDLWILDNMVVCDKEKRDILLKECELLEFAKCCRELSEFWFSDSQESEMILKLQQFILNGGVYGSSYNRHSVVQAKNDNKLKYIVKTVFLSYDKLKIQYPVINKHKWLTPFCEVCRWFKIFKPGYCKIAKDELIMLSKNKDEKIESVALFLEQIGLK